jgi:endonuclease III
MTRLPLSEVIDRLQLLYGRPEPPTSDPWKLILWENVAYLADDEHRAQAFLALEQKIGSRPQDIRSASNSALLEVTSHGIVARQSVQKLKKCAAIACEEFAGDLRPCLKLPLREAKRALQKFPGIGEPGAEKILLFCRSHPVFGLDSNGLRVLLRLGFGTENKNYATTYRSVQRAVEPELKIDFKWRIRAHQLLRRHGQELCRRNKPQCPDCPLAPECPDYQARLGR